MKRVAVTSAYGRVMLACKSTSLSAREIATDTGMSLHAVRNYVSRAMASGLFTGQRIDGAARECRYRLTTIGLAELDQMRQGREKPRSRRERKSAEIPMLVPYSSRKRRSHAPTPESDRARYEHSHAEHVRRQRLCGIAEELIHDPLEMRGTNSGW